MIATNTRWLAWTCLAIALAGCNGRSTGSKPNNGPSSPPASATASQPATTQPSTSAEAPLGVLSNGGEFFVLISPPPSKWPANELFTINVSVLNGNDRKPISGEIALNVDAAMPAHHHGMNTRPKVTKNPDGSFTARGMMLHMSGDWEVYFDVTRGGITERAQVAVTLP